MKTKNIRRRAGRRRGSLRRSVQFAFLALNVWIGAEFVLFVRQCERGEAAGARPAGVEGWLPIAGLLNLKAFAATGNMPAIHPAAMVLVAVFLLISLVLRRAFCGWLCPVGTLSEQLWEMGRRMRVAFRTPRWLDLALRPLKYLVLGFFLYAVYSMPVEEIEAFMRSPYAVVADVKMLDFFRHLSLAAAMVLGVLIAGSMALRNFWCRNLCPYGALMGLAALASPLRIRREASACVNCGLCTKACPALLPVDKLIQIRSAECTGCLDCVEACPVSGALAMETVGRRRVSAPVMAGAAAALFVGAVVLARATGHWEGAIPMELYRHWIAAAETLSH